MSTWRVRYTPAADKDIDELIEFTGDRFGATQAVKYLDLLERVEAELRRDPFAAPTRSMPDGPSGVYLHPIRRHGAAAAHVLMLRIDEADQRISILRVLHSAMDLPRHLDDEPEGAGG